MAQSVGCASVDELIDAVVPESIRKHDALHLPAALTEAQALK
ncbi:MAG: hypothetical protein RL693_1149, partial [Verrucomicrobiota bacterium]|jgi:glycine dehydrogenase